MSAKPIKAIRSEQGKIKTRLLMKRKCTEKHKRLLSLEKAIRSQQGNNIGSSIFYMPAKTMKDNTFSARQKHRKIKLINTRKA